MNKKILNKLHNTELEILDEFVKICKKEKLGYFLCGGTLLGAVRHKGFIPWDDDIDVGMLRDDYEKFIKVAPKYLNNKFILENNYINKNYYLNFSKIKNKNTIYLEKNTINYKDCNGIWIDIFPFDYHKNGLTKKLKFKSKISKFLNSMIIVKKLNLKVNHLIKKIVLKFVPVNFLFKIDKWLTNCKNNNYNYIVSYSIVYPIEKHVYKKQDMLPFSKVEFEGKKYNAPNNPDLYLKILYGDYMKLPPKEKRIIHNPMKIKFENEKIINFGGKKDGQ